MGRLPAAGRQIAVAAADEPDADGIAETGDGEARVAALGFAVAELVLREIADVIADVIEEAA